MEQIETKLYNKVMEVSTKVLFALSLSGDEWVVVTPRTDVRKPKTIGKRLTHFPNTTATR